MQNWILPPSEWGGRDWARLEYAKEPQSQSCLPWRVSRHGGAITHSPPEWWVRCHSLHFAGLWYVLLGLNGFLIWLHLAFLTRTAVGNGIRNLSVYSRLMSSSDGLLNYILVPVTVGLSDWGMSLYVRFFMCSPMRWGYLFPFLTLGSPLISISMKLSYMWEASRPPREASRD